MTAERGPRGVAAVVTAERGPREVAEMEREIQFMGGPPGPYMHSECIDRRPLGVTWCSGFQALFKR